MNEQSFTEDEFKTLKIKLETAIASRTALEKDFSSQSSLLIQFIDKLSHAFKGMDVELDNRLSKLRNLFKKSAPITEIQTLIADVLQILKKYTIKNENNIQATHKEFQNIGKILQKTSGLPDDLRRNLRTLLNENSDNKKSLIQYPPILITLLHFYTEILQTTIQSSNSPVIASQTAPKIDATVANKADPKIVNEFILILNDLSLSDKHNQELVLIKKDIIGEISNDKLIDNFLKTFNVIIEDFKQERQTAKIFLSTLSETLSTVQDAVISTISNNKDNKNKQDLINKHIQNQVIDITKTVDTANSLIEIKTELHTKLQLINDTLKKKHTLEDLNQKSLESQLNEMTAKVASLEKQSDSFEKQLQEQQIKSMQDALTKLGNRAAYNEYIAKEMLRFHHKPFELAIVILDLDDFKRINDTYGHTAGDKTLQVIANTLTKKVATDAFIGRYGGEEFVLIYSGVNKEDLIKTLTSLKTYIARLPFKFKNNKVSITTSIGVSHVMKEDNMHITFERADKALYQAKSQGKNQVVYL